MCLLLLATQVLPIAVWAWQRRPGALGGPISPIKALWLVYAIVLWILVPCLLFSQHPGYRLLAASMLVRAILEIPLCVGKKWKVAYGLGHDFLHLALTLGLLQTFRQNSGFVAICTLTALSLLTEIVFVRWFAAATAGPDSGVYFVPGGEEFRALNRRTALLFLPQYALFLILIAINLRG